jgi:hypothetical protein
MHRLRTDLLFLLLSLPVLFFAAGRLHGQAFFWEAPRDLVSSGARFPAAAAGGGLAVVVWQEIVPRGDAGGDVWLSLRSSRDARTWRETRRFAGPVPYEGKDVPLYSLVVDPAGGIYIALSVSGNQIDVLRSGDGGANFRTMAVLKSSITTLAPTLSLTAGGNLLLFVTQESNSFLSTHYAVSRDGSSWTEFRPLVSGQDLPINFLPSHVSLGGREYVVFQAWPRTEKIFYQLYMESSSDGGFTWSPATSLAFAENVEGQQLGEEMFSNQRPFLANLGATLGLAWERQVQANPSQIYFGELDTTGAFKGQPEPVTRGLGAAHFPQLLLTGQRTLLFWFDSRRGDDHVFFAERKGTRWEERDLSPLTGSSYFAYPVLLQDRLYVFWENRVGGNSRLVLLAPDQQVAPAVLRAVNFDPRKPSRQDLLQVRWTLPSDSSGVAGVDYAWSQDPEEPVGEELRLLSDTTSLSLTADRDGTWYFRLAVEDYAGNWSRPVALSFTRDTQPPGQPTLLPLALDPAGFLESNTFTLSWLPPDPAEGVVGYSYALAYLGAAEAVSPAAETAAAPAEAAVPAETAAPPAAPSLPDRPLTTGTSVTYANRDDGVWAFAVAALDEAGNLGPAATALLRLDKYIPVTYISYVSAQADALGSVELTIGGRGFEVGGTVGEVLLDRDAAPPYDYTFSLSLGQFRVVSDRLIRNLALMDIQGGSYRVGVRHPTRGLRWSPTALSIESTGTVKFGDFSYVYQRTWQRVNRVAHFITVNNLAVWLLLALLALLLVVSVRRLAGIAREGQLLRHEVLAVIRGEASLYRKEEIMKEMKRRGASLRLKFTLLIMVLVLIIVLMVSIPLILIMLDNQRSNLTEGLRQRTEVLLGSIASAAQSNLPSENRLELGLLPDQIRSMEEAQYTTITGPGVQDKGHFDYVWATNDPSIDEKLLSGQWGPAAVGLVRIDDELSSLTATLEQRVNEEARQRVSSLAEQIGPLSAEANRLVVRAGTDAEARRRLDALQEEISALDAQILAQLRQIGAQTLSYPAFETTELLPFYVFYHPIVYRRVNEDVYFRGVVRLGVSTQRISAELTAAQNRLLFWTGIIALAAAGLGLVGAIILTLITINPIKKLAAGVAVIRDTEDEEDLKDHVVNVRSRDEIGMLAATVNEMTQKLVKAAIARKDLTVGKDVQRMFMPLELDASGNKGNTGGEETEAVEIFGFYEGAKGVSGDYFDYVRLGERYYAVIKCDVSGKGVSAALIMVEVATIFSTYFRDWTPKAPGLELEPLAYKINDMLEERGFRGKFAALQLAILDARTGKAYFCNAGDTKLHLFRAAERKLMDYDLPKSPAAGSFASDLVQMQAPFKQVAHELRRGDILFLFTDGIEEARRHLRNERFQVVPCEEPGLEHGQQHAGTHKKDDDYEEMGLERIYGLLNAVLNRGSYSLVKFHNPLPGEPLTFDFSQCRGSVEEAVLALVAAEKIFRLVPDPGATGEDRVYVDRRIDAFLKEHFSQYGRYFTHPLASQDGGAAVTFTHLKEDEQYDDLTILAIRKK